MGNDYRLGLSIGQYLIRRLQDYGIRDVFGIPGDYVLSFYAQLEQSELNVVGCTREDCAGFAADAYARIHGMGALCITYCVGGLSVCNSIAGAFAEKSPVVVISGSPGLSERSSNPLLHHMVRRFSHANRCLRKTLRRNGRGVRPGHGVPRHRPCPGCLPPLQASRVHRDPAQHGGRGTANWTRFPNA